MTTLAWRFVPADLRLPHGDGRPIVVGEWIEVEPPIVVCKRGLHASERALDALQYADSQRVRLARVECNGEVVRRSDKLACSRMRHLWVASEEETQRELRLFACWCARQALATAKTPDPRSVTAIEVSERFARGEATRAELDAAWAAWAAGDAAGDAAGAAAWAAGAAAWAARDAARAAAWAAGAAAGAAGAAWAARDAARAAGDAAGAAQNVELTRRFEAMERAK